MAYRRWGCAFVRGSGYPEPGVQARCSLHVSISRCVGAVLDCRGSGDLVGRCSLRVRGCGPQAGRFGVVWGVRCANEARGPHRRRELGGVGVLGLWDM